MVAFTAKHPAGSSTCAEGLKCYGVDTVTSGAVLGLEKGLVCAVRKLTVQRRDTHLNVLI